MCRILSSGVGNSIKWTNLNPQSLMKSIRASGENSNFPFDILENYMKRVSGVKRNILPIIINIVVSRI